MGLIPFYAKSKYFTHDYRRFVENAVIVHGKPLKNV